LTDLVIEPGTHNLSTGSGNVATTIWWASRISVPHATAFLDIYARRLGHIRAGVLDYPVDGPMNSCRISWNARVSSSSPVVVEARMA
jgi:hypothetical protein